jgi:hypothetical protein
MEIICLNYNCNVLLCRLSLKTGHLMSGVLPDTVKISVNGYKRNLQPGNEDIRRYQYALWGSGELK